MLYKSIMMYYKENNGFSRLCWPHCFRPADRPRWTLLESSAAATRQRFHCFEFRRFVCPPLSRDLMAFSLLSKLLTYSWSAVACRDTKLNILLLSAVLPPNCLFRLLTLGCLDNQVLLSNVVRTLCKRCHWNEKLLIQNS